MSEGEKSTGSFRIGDEIPWVSLEASYCAGTFNWEPTRHKGKYLLVRLVPSLKYTVPLELAALEATMDRLSDIGCDVVVVSTDSTQMQEDFRKRAKSQAGLGGMSLTLVSDPYGGWSRQLGVLKKDEDNVCYNSTCLFDPDGRLVAKEVMDICVGSCPEQHLLWVEAAVASSKENSWDISEWWSWVTAQERPKARKGVPPNWKPGMALVNKNFKTGV